MLFTCPGMERTLPSPARRSRCAKRFKVIESAMAKPTAPKPSETPEAAATNVRKARAQSLSRAVAGLARRTLDKRGFVDAAIVNEWPTIAGELIGRHSVPDRIAFSRDRKQPGVLYLVLSNGALATEVIHFEPVLLERINRYFGFRAVGSLKIIHGPLPAPRTEKRKPLPPLNAEARAEIEQSLTAIDDDDIKAALDRLGSHVSRRRAADG